MKLKKLLVATCVVLMISMIFGIGVYGCMDVMVGKDATVDGSVITSHTVDGWYDSDLNIRVIPGQKFPKGAMVDVYWGLVREEVNQPKKIGEISQVEQTYTYFHDAYSHSNEHQLMIGETTIGQKEELSTFVGEEAIMTIEQLEAFALQRTKTARDAKNKNRPRCDKAYGRIRRKIWFSSFLRRCRRMCYRYRSKRGVGI